MQASQGSALLAVYWFVAFLSLGVFTLVFLLYDDIGTRGASGQLFRAEQLADMGIAVAANDQVKNWDPVLSQTVGPLESFEATIESEGARINLNAVLLLRERGVLERLFLRWGAPSHEVGPLVDRMLDWVDADHSVTGFGAEQPNYLADGFQNRPPNRPFETLDEVNAVPGFSAIADVRPNWRETFTIWSSAVLDLSDASPENIAVVCNCGEGSAEAFVALRRGIDGIENTEDDPQMNNWDDVWDILGIPSANQDSVARLVTMGDPVLRLRAVGRVQGVEFERIVTTRGRGRQIAFLHVQSQWKIDR